VAQGLDTALLLGSSGSSSSGRKETAAAAATAVKASPSSSLSPFAPAPAPAGAATIKRPPFPPSPLPPTPGSAGSSRQAPLSLDSLILGGAAQRRSSPGLLDASARTPEVKRNLVNLVERTLFEHSSLVA
jgi:hypothetical protein